MRVIAATAVSVLINVVAYAALQWSVVHAQVPPRGEVLIVQLPDTAVDPTYAEAHGPRADVASL